MEDETAPDACQAHGFQIWRENVLRLFSTERWSIVTEMDYSEKYQPSPNREMQSEHFGKDADVSMEIRIVSFQDAEKARRVVSYSHISDEKPQIAATTFQNTINMLNDLRREEN